MSDCTADDDLRWLQATRVVAGGLDADETARVREWLSSTPEGAAMLADAAYAWSAANGLGAMGPVEWNTEAAMRRFAEARAGDAPSPHVVMAARGGVRVGPRLFAAAALVGVLVGVGWWRQSASASVPHPTGPMVLVAKGGDAPMTVTLADGSQVTLAPGSTLRSAADFGHAHRQVELTGEALFTVTRGAAPFRVRVRDVMVEDLSTAFVVRERSSAVLVTVVEGAVVVGARRDTVRAGTGGLVTAAGLVEPHGPEVARQATSWTDGRLVFDNEPLGDVVSRLSRWSGRAIEVDASLARRRVTVTFDGEPPDVMVEVLAATIGGQGRATTLGWRLSERPR
ncbi:FecR family protein [Gemmatimonas sp.]|jgi:ferric-dicitrate binding protein FerR (iron transport regulator)|uniref:FecR family protein n=1 Tax=Gemmatimonas sp. TaxID=1962908 RepID=UPI00391A8EB0